MSNFLKVCLLVSACQQVHTLTEKNTLYVLSVLPYPKPQYDTTFQPVWDEGPSVYLAGRLAVRLINDDNSNILNGYTLELIQADGGCNVISTTTISLVQELFYKDKNVLGIIGPGCSRSALLVSKIISSREKGISIPTIHLGGSPSFAERELFPYSFSMLDFSKAFSDALGALMYQNGWNNVVILYDESNIYYTTILEYFQRNFGEKTTIPIASVVYENHIPFNEIKQSNTRIILLFVASNMFRRILCSALGEGLTYPIYQWVFINKHISDLKPVNTTYKGLPLLCDLEQMHEAANLSIYLRYHDRSLHTYASAKPTASGLTQNQFKRRYNRMINNYNHMRNSSIKASLWATFYFDAVWAMALSLNNSIRELQRQGLELAEFRYGQNEVAEIVQKQILQLTFDGVSGSIAFDKTTGFVGRGVNVLQLQERELKLLMYFNDTGIVSMNANVKLQAIEDNFDNFGSISRVPDYIIALCLVTTVIILILLTSSHFISIVYRKFPSVKASNLKIVHMAYFGCYLTILGITCDSAGAILGSDRQRKCWLVQATFVLVLCGMTLIYSTICARTWRLYRIFIHFTNPGRFISDWSLFVFVCSCLAVELPVVLAWAIADPIYPEIIRDDSLRSARIHCTSETLKIWLSVLIVYNATILFLSCYFALRCNKISQKDFKTNSILILAYVLTLEFTIGAGIYFLLPKTNNSLPEYLTMNITLLLYVVFCCFFLFLPPILPLLKRDIKQK